LIRIFTSKVVAITILIFALCGLGNVFAQQQPAVKKQDSLTVKTPYNRSETNNNRSLQGIFDPDPPNLVRTIEYDAVSNQYVLYERVGNMLYRPPRYLTFAEYLQLKEREDQRTYFKQLADNYAYQSQQAGFIPQIDVRSHTFEQ